MVEALKKIDKKILIIAGVIICFPILIIVFLAIMRSCSNSKITYEGYEAKMIVAAEKYFDENKKNPTKEREKVTVKLNTLVKKEYIKSSEDLLDDDSCEGSVTVRLNGSLIEENDGGFLNYTVNLECQNYKTNTLKSSILKDLTTQGNGLYDLNNRYVFKGDEVNNYISFFGTMYRIVNINDAGIVKLIKTESEPLDRYWDNKYNVNINDIYGKNIYADSAILKYMVADYNNDTVIKNSSKKHIVSTDVCIDSRDLNDNVIGDYSCINKLEKQVIALLDISDFARASLDPDCNSITSKSCGNYNYLKKLNLNTWTPIIHNKYIIYQME